MKFKFLIIAVIAATVMFSSCNKSNDIDGSENEGLPTTMQLSFSLPNIPQTRNVTGDPNGTADESKINSLDVFIYHTASGDFDTHQNIGEDKFIYRGYSGKADLYFCTERVAATTGNKSVFLGINLPEKVVNGLKGQPASALSTIVQNMSRDELAGTENFVMFSVREWKGTFELCEDENNVLIECQRLVAKITVETDKNMKITGAEGLLKNKDFAVVNFNKKQFLFLELPYKDPNWEKGSYHAADFYPLLSSDYAPVTIGSSITGAPQLIHYTPRYAAENTSEGKLKKEITRVVIRSAFIPKNITEGTTGNFTVNDIQTSEPKTFYSVTPSSLLGTSFFFDRNVANAYKAEFGGDIIEYSNGLCYWDIFLGKNPIHPVNKWDVVRNSYYRCKITGMTTPGRNTPDVPDPEVPPGEEETHISAEIQILFWTVREENTDLI